MKKKINIVDLILGIVFVILVVALVLVTISKNNEEKLKQELEAQTVQESIVEDNVYMNSPTGDEDYNYIINANKLAKYDDIPVSFYMTLSDEVNKELKAKGYKGEEVTILSVMQRGLSYDITMAVNEEQFMVNYLTYTDETTVIFQ